MTIASDSIGHLAPATARKGRTMALSLRYALRELRGGLRGFYVFIACIALGVMAICGVGSVAASLGDGMAREGRNLLGGDKGIWTEVDRSTGDFYALIDPVPPELDALQPARVAFMAQHPVMRHVYRSPASTEARLISDFLTPHEFHRLALYGEFFAPLDVEDQITVPLRATPHRLAGVSVDRGQFGFTDLDRTLLNRLQPHLVTAHQNSLAYTAALTT